MRRKTGRETQRQINFDEILLESIDQALLSLGENTKSAVYFHLATRFAISKQNIPERIDDFSEALEQIFGLAAPKLEILIMKYLNEKIKCAYYWAGPKWLVPELTFSKYVKMMQIWLDNKEEIENVEVLFNAGEQKQQT